MLIIKLHLLLLEQLTDVVLLLLLRGTEMKLLPIIFSFMFLTGCISVKPIPFNGPNNNQAFSMVCSGAGRTLAECYQVAGSLCSKGYVVIGQGNSMVGVPTASGMILAPKKDLTIECKSR